MLFRSNEALPGFEFVGWYGVVGPARMPQPVVAKIHAETAAYVKTPEFMKRAIADGAEAVGSDPESFRQMMLADMYPEVQLLSRVQHCTLNFSDFSTCRWLEWVGRMSGRQLRTNKRQMTERV